ncbi:hypothetical protein [Streptomyces sp. NPDC001508]|uniref:hypothetical protein n=1 Tax=Streptomyces sp. NPDC001508 TaxID=3154656 RepID=UPI003328C3F4
MTSADPAHRTVALALTGEQVLAALADPAALALLDTAPIAFTVVGVDRVTAGAPDGRPTVDAATAVAVLTGRTDHAAFLVAASPTRDHPYNLARRITSVAHLSRRRTGVVVGGCDPYVPRGAGRARGDAPVLTGPPGAQAVRDLALAVQKLEQTWPYDAIVADRERRIFARGDLIRHAHHDGVFPTAGPLTLPATPEGASVLAWWINAADELPAAAEVADVLVAPAGRDATAAARRAVETAPRGHFADPGRRPLVLAPLAVAADATAQALRAAADALLASGADGLVLRPADADPTTAIRLAARLTPDAGPARSSLRARLGLPATADLLPPGPGVFPAPAPIPPVRTAETVKGGAATR